MLSQAEILDRVRVGDATFRWVDLPVGGRLVLRVMPDALRLDGLRVPVSARTAQQAADLLGAMLPTALIEDLVWRAAAVRVRPKPQRPDWWSAHMWEAVEQCHQDIQEQLPAELDPGAIIATVGKSWVLTNELLAHEGRAANYGWHHSGAGFRAVSGSMPVWQPLSTAHNADHWDYSQTLRLVARDCLVDGAPRDLHDVLQDRELAPLVSHEGPLRLLRQPGVEEITGAVVLPPQEISA